MNNQQHAEYDPEEEMKPQTTVIAARPQMPAMSGANALVQRTLGEVQVAVMMAKQFPRDKIISKEKLVIDCCREGLAEKARYVYSRGGNEITGPTIRFAEAAKNAWGNLQSGFRELTRSRDADGVGISEIEAFAWDTENNTRQSTTFIVRHWRDTKKGGYALKDERDIREMISNQAKRVERTCILNSIDGDIIEDGLRQCDTTLSTKVKVTPERLENMLKGFEKYRVTKEQIEKRIQRRYDAINPALLISLTRIFNSLEDGMSKPDDWFDPIETDEKTAEKKGNEGVAAVMKKKKAKDAGADPDTGEIKTQSKPEATPKPTETPKEEVKYNLPKLETVEDVKTAASVLILTVEAAPAVVRPSLFVQMHGMPIVDALRTHGQGILIGEIKRLGIALPE